MKDLQKLHYKCTTDRAIQKKFGAKKNPPKSRFTRQIGKIDCGFFPSLGDPCFSTPRTRIHCSSHKNQDECSCRGWGAGGIPSPCCSSKSDTDESEVEFVCTHVASTVCACSAKVRTFARRRERVVKERPVLLFWTAPLQKPKECTSASVLSI